MKFFADTADIMAIEQLHDLGLVDGVTTNPSLIAKSGRNFLDVVRQITALLPGPVSAEVTSTDLGGMIAEGEHLARIAENVVVKLPLTLAGLAAAKHFSTKGVKTNVTLCFSPNQALLAAKAGATFVSPFIGRLDDINLDGIVLIEQIRRIYDNYEFATQVLAASVRTPNHVTEVALAGADVATMPPDVIMKLASHPLTDAGIAGLLKDWKATGQAIL
jgi:transaldolase